MISYLKVIQNPDDSISLLRVINTPVRGIGKTTIETIERLALETGLSMWGAVGEAITRQLLPARALAALKNFRELIEDGQAMLAGTFVERVEETAASAENAAELTHPVKPTPGLTETPVRSAGTGEAPVPTQPLPTQSGDDTAFDPGNFGFDFAANAWTGEDARPSTDEEVHEVVGDAVEGFRGVGAPANTAEILKFLIDRTGYIKLLEEEDTPEAYSRIENLRELVNAAMDSRDRGETLDQFLDHAALVSDADEYDEHAQITLMTLHAAKGLEFPLVVLAGMEEGLFPHSRTMLEPDAIEEERRLCYVGMTRAMDTLILTRAVYRRRYGTDMPEASVPSRFLEEVPRAVGRRAGRTRRSAGRVGTGRVGTGALARPAGRSPATRRKYPLLLRRRRPERRLESGAGQAARQPTPARELQLHRQHRRVFCLARQEVQCSRKCRSEEPTGRRGFRPGQKVRHPKYGEGTVYQREGEGEEAKITVQFPRFGLKKLVEKYAQLEKA